MLGSTEALRNETGLNTEPISRNTRKPVINLATGNAIAESETENTTKSRSGRRRVGQRNPKRDKTGTSRNSS